MTINIALKHIALAMFVATTQFAGAAYAQTPKAPAAAASTKAPIPTWAPDDWIVYDHTTYTPVVDPVSRHLYAARKAFDAKDHRLAAREMRAAADELKSQSERASKANESRLREDNALLASDTKFAQDSIRRMNASVQKLGSAAAAIESGRIRTRVDLDKAIDTAARAGMERRWLVTDVATWYRVSEEPQHHFTDAVAAYARKNYKAAAADIRKAAGYLRLEAGRATGAVRRELDGSVARLDRLTLSVEKGYVKGAQSMAKAFAEANRALALAHRTKAAESWARKEYDAAGYELKAAAHALESAAGWAGGEIKANASAAVADARALGDKLASGVSGTRDEIAQGLEALGNRINALGRTAGSHK